MPIETGDAEGSDEKTAPVLDDVISAPVLLVACDYDGTISPHVDDPVRAAARSGVDRRAAVARIHPRHSCRRHLGPVAARPRRAEPAPTRSPSRRLPRIRVRTRLCERAAGADPTKPGRGGATARRDRCAGSGHDRGTQAGERRVPLPPGRARAGRGAGRRGPRGSRPAARGDSEARQDGHRAVARRDRQGRRADPHPAAGRSRRRHLHRRRPHGRGCVLDADRP